VCGIAAILSSNSRQDWGAIARITAVLNHRGPDDEGFVFLDGSGRYVLGEAVEHSRAPSFQPEVALGFRRLSIIDLSPQGHQPMCNEDGSVWLVFNGEIYNYLELARTLRERGHTFRSSSDTEVILHAYEEWGSACVNEFNGMWAFALWDARRRRLFCSRDRFGVKPLYYSWDEKTFCLASEPKGILASGLVPAKVNFPYLIRFLTDSVQQDGEETFYEGILSLLPAHSLILEGGKLRRFRYWDYDHPSVSRRYDFSDPDHTFRGLLIDSVRIRLRSDVPVGACLSGGLDSSSIVGIVSHLNEKRSLDTFSATFDFKRNDESAYMRLAAKASGSRSHFIRVDPRELAEVMPRIVWHLDGPCLSASTYPFWKVSQLASEQVKVLLDGQGADELLGGYFGFFPACVVESARAALRTRSAKALVGAGAQLAGAVRTAGWRQLYFLYRDYSLLGRKLRLHRCYLRSEAVIRPEMRAFAERRNGHKPEATPRKFADELTQVLYEHHSRSNLPGLLQYADGISMAHSLEARLPFLDYRLVEFCFALPPETKIRGTTTKWLLRRAMRGLVPDAILDRGDKIGFATPFASWIRGPLRDFMMDTLDGTHARQCGVFDPVTLRKVIQRHVSGRLDMSFYIWRWLATELWLLQLEDWKKRSIPNPKPVVLSQREEPRSCALPS